jgi:hypothetical protein
MTMGVRHRVPNRELNIGAIFVIAVLVSFASVASSGPAVLSITAGAVAGVCFLVSRIKFALVIATFAFASLRFLVAFVAAFQWIALAGFLACAIVALVLLNVAASREEMPPNTGSRSRDELHRR